MAPAKRKGDGGWTRLLAEPDGRGGGHARLLRRVADYAARPLSGSVETYLAGADQALAARLALQGAGPSREFLQGVASMVKAVARRMATFPDMVADRAVLDVLSLVGVGETAGGETALGPVDLGPRFDRFVVNKTFSKQDDLTVAWLALGLGRVGDIARLFAPGEAPAKGDDAVALLKAAAAALESRDTRPALASGWTAYLRAFPAALAAEKAEWRHLLLAARVVMGRIERVPMGDVADALHRRVVELAREEAG